MFPCSTFRGGRETRPPLWALNHIWPDGHISMTETTLSTPFVTPIGSRVRSSCWDTPGLGPPELASPPPALGLGRSWVAQSAHLAKEEEGACYYAPEETPSPSPDPTIPGTSTMQTGCVYCSHIKDQVQSHGALKEQLA